MEDFTLGYLWIFSVVIGALIGAARGRVASGLVWPLLLGPLGVIVVLCLPNLAREARDAREDKLKREQIDLQRAELKELRALRAALEPGRSPAPARRPAAPRPGGQNAAPLASYYILVDGKPEGPLEGPTLMAMLSAEEITPDTLCAREGDADWRKTGEVFAQRVGR